MIDSILHGAAPPKTDGAAVSEFFADFILA